MNPLFNRFGNHIGNNPAPASGPFGNVLNMANAFRQFKQNFQGDPREQVQNMLNSGQMSQEQFNQLSNMAAQFKDVFK